MTNGRKRPKPQDLGDAPETRLQNIPTALPASDAEDRRLVETFLASNPQVAAQVRGWQQDAQHLRAALGAALQQPANPDLDPEKALSTELSVERSWSRGRAMRRKIWFASAM